MMTILAIVNADKEGQIESKIMKSRQMEEIREARRKEAEARQEQRKKKLVRYLAKSQAQNQGLTMVQDETKDSLRKRRKKKSHIGVDTDALESDSKTSKGTKAARKRVSFA